MAKINTIENKSYPGQQRSEWSFNSLITLLVVLTIILFLLTLYAAIQENSAFASHELRRFFSLKLLDTKTAASLFVTLMGILLVRNQFVLGFKPRIIYECKKTKSTGLTSIEPGLDIWQVRMRNVGLGAAVFRQYKFSILPPSSSSNDLLNFSDVIQKMDSLNLEFQKDYTLMNITDGYTLPAKEDKIIFEIRSEKVGKLNRLDLYLKFEGFLGGRYTKEIFLIPRDGLKTAPLIIMAN